MSAPQPLDIRWEEHGLNKSCQVGFAVAMFQFHVLDALKTWDREWHRSLDKLDTLLRVKVGKIPSSVVAKALNDL